MAEIWDVTDIGRGDGDEETDRKRQQVKEKRQGGFEN